MDNTQHNLDNDDIDLADSEQLLAQLEAMQANMPPAQILVNAVGQALQRKNQLISILAEALMESDCDCDGCVRMRKIVTAELDMEVVIIGVPAVDPGTLEKCLTTEQ